jgi:hypothetical protein
VKNVFGVEMNEEFCEIQQEMLQKYKMDKRVTVREQINICNIWHVFIFTMIWLIFSNLLFHKALKLIVFFITTLFLKVKCSDICAEESLLKNGESDPSSL